jgi:hypothetical protein
MRTILLLVALAMPWRAEAHSANQMLSYCEELISGLRTLDGGKVSFPKGTAAPMCWGFMSAIQDVATLSLDERRISLLAVCVSPDATLTQLIRVFVAYARANPGDLHESAGVIAVRALQHHFPCRP